MSLGKGNPGEEGNMNFTKREFDNFRDDLKKALAPLEEKYKLSITQGNIRYGDLTFTITLTADKTERDGMPVDKEKEEYLRYCAAHGLKPENYRTKCRVIGEADTVYLIAGINPRARTNSLIIERESDGKRFACARSMIFIEGDGSSLSGFKVTVDGDENKENPDNEEKMNFQLYCRGFNLKPEDYRTRCHVAHDAKTVYLLAGIKPNARKNCIIIEREKDGKRFVCAREAIILDKDISA